MYKSLLTSSILYSVLYPGNFHSPIDSESPLHVVTTTDVNTDDQSQQLPESEDADELDDLVPSRKDQVKSRHTFLQIREVLKKVFRILLFVVHNCISICIYAFRASAALKL